jgi:hypothetical protein
MYALKSSEARRQYPKRLKMLFDYIKLPGTLEEQARGFLDKAVENGIQWAQDRIMIFLDFHKERVRRKELVVHHIHLQIYSLKYYMYHKLSKDDFS